MKKSSAYDVVIIGAGIGGLVCGCYLAKAGMKVLIMEQHHKPGGYCTSFRRKGFLFDAAAHSFGGYRRHGVVRKVLDELGVDKRVQIIRYDPSDIITVPGNITVGFWADHEKTILDFQNAFPDEKDRIRDFFSFLLTDDPVAFVSLRKQSFQTFLDSQFTNGRLKAMLSFPLLGNGGLPPSLMAAFIGVRLFKEFLLDGGYYPEGGMQKLSDAFAETFRAFGGRLRLSCQAKKITVKNNTTVGVRLETGEFVPAKQIVANCDAMQLLLKLLGKKYIKPDLLRDLDNMIPSLSMFILYLAIANTNHAIPSAGTNYWYLPHYDIESMFLAALKRAPSNVSEYMVRVSPDRRTILSFVNASYRTSKYWSENKESMMQTLIEKIEEHVIPGLSKCIIYKDSATPHTLHRYTLNHKGAAYGWASSLSQLANPNLRKPFMISGITLTGHWTAQGMGIPSVIYSGYEAARSLIRKFTQR